jgi:preprotein translocase subunit SecG
MQALVTFVTIIYIIVSLVMVLSILLQAGKGGGLGSALGGGASQGVFGGGGGADFMAKLTQGFAATFMICAMFLAYASAHAGSGFLEQQDKGTVGTLKGTDEIDYEFVGYNPQKLPTPEEGRRKQAQAAALVPAQSAADGAAPPAPADEAPSGAPTPDEEGDDIANRGEVPDSERGESPHSGDESLQNPSADAEENGDSPADEAVDEDLG